MVNEEIFPRLPFTIKKMRISASSYSNTAPLIWSFLYGSQRGKYELILDNAPARSAALLVENRIDAALVPVIQYQRITDVYLVPDVCVGAQEKVRSVCLVTNGIDLPQVKTVALDVSSRTSVALTKIIFREFYDLAPEYKDAKPDVAAMLAENDCALLIGDPALTIDETEYRKFDLVEVWRKFTGFGFVFAMWMTNADKIESARQIDFAAARDEGLNNLDQIAANYQSQIKLAPEDLKKYLSENISYTINDKMRQGMELYFKLARKIGLIEEELPVKYL